MRYRITLSYDGADFCGWQSQPNGNSVQDAVEIAIEKLSGEKPRVTGSGRTDAGVHAVAQVAHFDLEKEYPPKTIVGALNAYLPKSVRVTAAQVVCGDFDALRNVKKKTYMYLMYCGDALPLVAGRAAVVGRVDAAAMNDAARSLIGTHDFATFMAAGGGAKTSTRTVYDAYVERDGDFVEFFITANGFLYNMVRIISAQLIKVGRGENVDIPALIAARDRSAAKDIAPAHGLYLYKVEYANHRLDLCRV